MKTVKTTKSVRTLPLILVIALIMTLALPMGVFADTPKGKITVKTVSESIVLDAEDFSAYQLFSLVISGSGASTKYAYTPVDEIGVFLEWATSKYENMPSKDSPYGETAAEFKLWLEGEPTSDEMKQLTYDLMESEIFEDPTEGTQADKFVEFSGLEYGYYLVVGEGTPKAGGDNVIAHASLVTLASTNEEIELKADVPTIDKEVYDEDSEEWTDVTDVNTGDTVDFRITSYVPNMFGYDNYTFTVHDTMSKGLTYNNGSVKITLVNPAGTGDVTLVEDTDFTLGVDEAEDDGSYKDGTAITIDFTDFIQHKDRTDWEIRITYDATLNDEALIASDSNPNKVRLEYSNDPYFGLEGNTDGDGTGTTEEVEVDVYTFNLEIVKVDGMSTDNLGRLPGAKFSLLTETEEGEAGSAIKFRLVETGNETDPSIYIVDIKNGTITELLSPESGLIHIIGIDAGDYFLRETEAPAGYNKIAEDIKVTVTHTIDENGSDYITLSEKVINKSGAKLPSTGGIGTTVFYLISAMLTIGLAVFLIANKKRNLLNAK
ncbi:MAG: SpaH/EbpB family LPXTG-anchored major pilin [Clostridiales bacterium]|nr:SpaH/EbpB family LPXTG-anchored major pilin [Clostridiales bacterium]